MPSEKYQQVLSRLDEFVCRRCNQCCKQPGFVKLAEEEVNGIAAYLGVSIEIFMDRYTQVQERRFLVLKKYQDESCIFLTPEGCSIHSAKPGQCRDFPSQWLTPRSLEYCEGLKALIS